MRQPKLCYHRATGRGYVTDPRTKSEVYFVGAWGDDPAKPSPEVQSQYDRWLAKLLLARDETGLDICREGLTLAELCSAYYTFAQGYYRRGDGKMTSESGNIAHALEYLLRLYPATPVDEFGPLALKEVRGLLAKEKFTRKFINDQIHRIRRMFSWGVENELVQASTMDRLREVKSLRKGKTKDVPEQKKVPPVPFTTIDATLTKTTPLISALIRFHLHGGMRAEEAVSARPCDINRSSTPWLYQPRFHKTIHHDIERAVWLGPKARAAIEPMLKGLLAHQFIFPGRGRGPHSKFEGHITVSGYKSKIETACRKAGAPIWTPRQLRHTWLTFLRQEHPRGIEAAQVVGGHQQLNTTEIYAEKSEALAQDAAEKFG